MLWGACGGDKKYIVRGGTELRDSRSGEFSWLKRQLLADINGSSQLGRMQLERNADDGTCTINPRSYVVNKTLGDRGNILVVKPKKQRKRPREGDDEPILSLGIVQLMAICKQLSETGSSPADRLKLSKLGLGDPLPVEAIAGWFLREVKLLTRRGLLKQWRCSKAKGQFMRGNFNLTRQFNSNPEGILTGYLNPIHYDSIEYTVETEVNCRLLAALNVQILTYCNFAGVKNGLLVYAAGVEKVEQPAVYYSQGSEKSLVVFTFCDNPAGFNKDDFVDFEKRIQKLAELIQTMATYNLQERCIRKTDFIRDGLDLKLVAPVGINEKQTK